MNEQKANYKMTEKLFFRLLPIQVLLMAIGAVNGIVSSLFAGNYLGAEAMGAIGLYAPVSQFLTAVTVMLVGGAQILCGKYMGKNQVERTQDIFSTDMLITTIVSAAVIALLVVASLFDLTTVLTEDTVSRALLNRYILGQAAGVLPMLLGQQLSAFLSLENRTKLTTAASVVLIIANLLLSWLFVAVMQMGIFGLALATSLGMWLFFLVQLSYYFSGKALLKFRVGFRKKDAGQIIGVGAPGALSQGYQTIRRLIVNYVILTWVGSIGISAFAASDAVFSIVWALPHGLNAVFRMLMSVSIGEEDRQSLADVMRTALYRAVPLMCAVVLALILLASPLTMLHYSDTSSEIYNLAVWGYRILPVCMPLSLIYMFFTCYAQAIGRQVLVNVMSLIDGLIGVALFSWILVPVIGLNGVFVANICNGILTTLGFLIYAIAKNRRMPKNVEELMVIPADFGVTADERMDLTLKTMEDVTFVSARTQAFCLAHGIDDRRAYFAALCLEEAAANVVEHGFKKDQKKHTVDVRVVHKENDLILRIKDDCVPFDPGERQKQADPEDITKNIGIRMVYDIAESVSYQNILGMNVLTVRV
ncbi:MAG: ATP-binding protein [Lachnospiraceae bacterium]|nr:ATP-binding protein [Lachnospiraceae bacterium]